jgi:uncharacterized delta-60 repeat protein
VIAVRLLRSLLLLTGLVLCLAAPALGAGPVLDPSFGAGGLVTGSAPQNAVFTGFAAVRAPDGRIYVDEGPGLFAFLPNGSPDTSFGEGGSVVFPSERWPTYFTVAGIAVDGQGRVLVAGTRSDNEPDSGEPSQVATVIRYLPDGGLDPTFADGGVLRTTFGFPLPRDESGLSPASADHVAVRLSDLGVDANGGVLLSGSFAERTVRCPNGVSYEMPLGFLARLGADGQLDQGFGQSGLAPQPGLGLITDLQVEPSGASAFTATPAGCALPRDGFLARVGADGRPDGGFGLGGRSRLAEPPARLAAAPDRGLLVLSAPERVGEGRESHSLTSIRRFRTDGSLDRGIGDRGRAALVLPGRSSVFEAVVADPRGRILLAGAVQPPGSAPQRRFVLQRLEADGSPDRRFGKRGRVTTGFGARARSKARAIMLAPGGRILLAGSLGASYLVNETGFALASYRP